MTGVVAWIVMLVAVIVAVVAVVRAQQAARIEYGASARAELMERQVRAAEARTVALTEEIRQLAGKRIPAAATALSHPTAPVPGLREAADIEGDAARLLTEAVAAARVAVIEERNRVDAAARAAMRGTSAKIQSLLNQSQQLLQELQHEYDDPRILQLDFRNELALRRTQATAVLCDAWPGLARQNSSFIEIVLGAQSRVAGYERIKVANHLRQERLALVARAAEPFAIALAELLANATAYSHPDTEVPVTVQQTAGRGALVLVDDAGIGMDDDALNRARALLAGPAEVLLTELGDPPQTGFAVVGRLIARYGFSCHIESSPYGGMRTMLRVPAHLLTVMDDDRTLSVLAPKPVYARGQLPDGTAGEAAPHPPQRSPGQPASPRPAAGHFESAQPGSPQPESAQPGFAPSAPGRPEPGPSRSGQPARHSAELPSRRRRSRVRAAPAATGTTHAPPPAAQEASLRTPEQARASWAALQQGTLGGRKATLSTGTTAGRKTPSSRATSAPSMDDQGDET